MNVSTWIRIALFLALLLGAPLGLARSGGEADATVSIELPADARSSGLEIHVADVAKVTGTDAALVARVAAASLGYAPAPGYSRTLRADLVLASLRQSLPGVPVAVVGAPRCRVTPAVRTYPGSELRAVAAEAMRGTLNGVDAEARPTGEVPDVQVPESTVEPRLVAVPDRGAVHPGRRNVQVQIWLGEQLYRTVHVSFEVQVWQRSAVLRQAVDVGTRMHAGLFEIKRVPISEAGGLFALPTDQLAGALAKRPIAAGAYVTERDVHREVVIERGALVTVCVRKGAVEVSDVAVAAADGRMGERVEVALRTTGRTLVGVVKGPQLVEVVIQ
ncbi:MAG: flagellar basal body P-ring formation chaperone FlgA [Planctomycetota bacterium]